MKTLTALRIARRRMKRCLAHPQMFAFLPTAMLAGFWLGGEALLMAVALLLPVVFFLAGSGARPNRNMPATDPVTGLMLRHDLVESMDGFLRDQARAGRSTSCIVIALDDADEVADRFGHAGFAQVLRRTGERLSGALRGCDLVARLDGATFAVGLAPVRQNTLESMMQIASRLQAAVQAPISLDATTVYLTCSVGFCLEGRIDDQSGQALLEAAEAAMAEARRNGPGALRAWTGEMQAALDHRHVLLDEIAEALDTGAIRPWFQPQISTDTGRITGFEALARWIHPDRGVIPPGEFLPLINAVGLSERLGEMILYHSLTALRAWDRAGLDIPMVAVNFSRDELRNPRLAEKMKWELDRFDLAPERLTVEVLETVVADTGNEVIVHNIAALARLGCGIDLDDFGTGHASIANIRRFTVARLKIDRSFVTRVDEDREQQRMVSAILSMAEQLGLRTLAEGVETAGEHAMLAQLGCGNVQGFGIARPMPFEETIAWVRRHQMRLAQTPQVSKRTTG